MIYLYTGTPGSGKSFHTAPHLWHQKGYSGSPGGKGGEQWERGTKWLSMLKGSLNAF